MLFLGVLFNVFYWLEVSSAARDHRMGPFGRNFVLRLAQHTFCLPSLCEVLVLSYVQVRS